MVSLTDCGGSIRSDLVMQGLGCWVSLPWDFQCRVRLLWNFEFRGALRGTWCLVLGH